MVVHRDNESSRTADNNSRVAEQNLVHHLTKAYQKAGEELAVEMAAAVVAVLRDYVAGESVPLLTAWASREIPPQFKEIIPREKLIQAEMLILSHGNFADHTIFSEKFFERKVLWFKILKSGHYLILIE